LADIAAQEHKWSEVLQLSSRGLELEPGRNAIAYEYHAAANLKLRNLSEAGKERIACD